jgi:hypothetical protein
VVASASAIALGTFVGGWRIINTLGPGIIEMEVAQGFAAQAAGATVILAASSAGYPLSTTHVISGSIMGSRAAKRLSAVRWGVAGNIVGAWTLSLPAAAFMGAGVYAISTLFGHGETGPLVISAALLLTLSAVFIRRLQQSAPATPGATQARVNPVRPLRDRDRQPASPPVMSLRTTSRSWCIAAVGCSSPIAEVERRVKSRASTPWDAALRFANLETLGVVGAQPRRPISSELRFGMNSGATPAPAPQSRRCLPTVWVALGSKQRDAVALIDRAGASSSPPSSSRMDETEVSRAGHGRPAPRLLPFVRTRSEIPPARRFRNAWPSDGRRPGPLTIPRGCDPLASARGYGSWVRIGGASGEGE